MKRRLMIRGKCCDKHKAVHGTATEIAPGLASMDCLHPIDEKCDKTGFGGGEVVYDSGKAHSGATSDAFRSGWDRIFAGEKSDGLN